MVYNNIDEKELYKSFKSFINEELKQKIEKNISIENDQEITFDLT
jgi:hypothetical protein